MSCDGALGTWPAYQTCRGCLGSDSSSSSGVRQESKEKKPMMGMRMDCLFFFPLFPLCSVISSPIEFLRQPHSTPPSQAES